MLKFISIKNCLKLLCPILLRNGIVEKGGGGGIKTRGRNFEEDTFKFGTFCKVGEKWEVDKELGTLGTLLL